jgi:potassium efflux system protein
LLLVLLMAVPMASTATSTIPSIPAEGVVSAEQLDAAITAIEAREDLNEETRGQIIALLRDAQAYIGNKASAEVAGTAFAEALNAAPEDTARLRAELDKDPGPPPSPENLRIRPDAALQELDQALTRELAEVASREARLAEIESQIKDQENRPTKARERINELRGTRDQLSAAIDAAPPAGELAVLTDARKLAAELRRDALGAELTKLEQELLSQTVRLDLLKAQRDLAARDLAYQQEVASVLQGIVNDKRQSAAAQAQRDAVLAELAAEGKHPVVRALAQGNADLTRELPEVAASIEQVTGQLAATEEQARDIEQRLARSKQRLEVGGINQVIGRLFVEEREDLPKLSQYQSEVRQRQSALSDIGLAQVRIEEQQRDLARLDVATELVLADVVEVADELIDADELDNIRIEVEQLLQNRRELLQQVGNTYTSYLRQLGDLDVAQRRLLEVAEDYKEFLDQHLLWIPSAPPFGAEELEDMPSAVAWALSPIAWASTVAIFFDALRDNFLIPIAVLLLLVLIISARRQLQGWSETLNDRIGKLSTDNIGLTLGCMAIAAVRALPLPLALAAAGWILGVSPSQSEFTESVARALTAVAPFLYNLSLIRMLSVEQGVMQRHFDWSERTLTVVRRQLRRMILFVSPILFFTVLVYSSPIPAHRESLGRIGFVAIMILLSMSLKPLAHPRTGVVANHYERNPATWVSRLRWLWYGIAFGGPLLLALAAIVGYPYTAGMLTRHLIDTLWLVLGIIVVNLVVLRWLALARRKIQWQQALEEREIRKAEQSTERDEQDEGEAPQVQSKPLDLDEVNQQTRRLMHAGLSFIGIIAAWGIWAEVLPALGILQQVSLWSRAMIVDGVQTISPVTLADLLLALVVIAVTFVASRNLPGLMEIAILRHLKLEPGSRYTINTLLQYVLVTIGAVAVLNIIGLNWSKIQWLVAALTVGLGFGLQEIVANFFSGLIILFERPVRVGDTVTVGQLTGTVSRIRIRATTITDWDNKEIIVPNKAFITEQVINWTLSDPITRVVVPVGISYGSDYRLATRVMQETLRRMPLVLDEPEPKVYFLGFGDSSLDFKLHAYSRQLADRLPLMHAVHEEIFAALKENGIEIPFPQRDLHVRSVAEEVKGLASGRDSKSGSD